MASISVWSQSRAYGLVCICANIITHQYLVDHELTDEQISVIDAMVSDLSFLEAGIIRERCGLDDGIPLKPEECAHKHGLSVEIVRETETRGYRNLRQPHRWKQLMCAFGLIPEEEQVLYDAALKIARGEAPMPTGDALNGVLIEALGLNVLYLDELKPMEIYTVGQLLELTAEDLRRATVLPDDMLVHAVTKALRKHELSLSDAS